jgi:hypothetical protein
MIVSDGQAMQEAIDRWHKPWDKQLRLMREEREAREQHADHSIDCDCILCVDGDE